MRLVPSRGSRLEVLAQRTRRIVAPLDLHRHVNRTRAILRDISPDLVHALRIPFEGMLASMAVHECPLLMSVWGLDFTLVARESPISALYTRRAVKRADALHADCHRDIRLAGECGFSSGKPSIVLPGAGGIHTDTFFPEQSNAPLQEELNLKGHSPVVINPRGVREYVRNEAFFRAIPLVLRSCPETVFLCSAMADSDWARNWVSRLGIESSVRLLPAVPHPRMAAYFRLAQVAVSPSVHDGTPNTLLESMACGCFPVAGDIEPLREWITEGVNGLLCNPDNPAAIAGAIVRSLGDDSLRERARRHNAQLIADRAEYATVMRSAASFYDHVVRQHSLGTAVIEG